MFGIGFTEIILIAVLAVVVLGPDKLPQLGKTLARFLSEFNKIKRDFRMTITDIERVGEKATSDINEDLDSIETDGKDEGENIEFVADDIDEVPETFEQERKRRPRRRRRAPRKAKVRSESSDSDLIDSSVDLKSADKADAPEKLKEKANASSKANASKAEVTSGAVPTPEGTRQAAGVIGVKPVAEEKPKAATKPRRRRRPAASSDKVASRATILSEDKKVGEKTTPRRDAASRSTDAASAKLSGMASTKPSRTAKSRAVVTDAADTNTKEATANTTEKKPARPRRPRAPRKNKVDEIKPEPATDARLDSKASADGVPVAVVKSESAAGAESSKDISQSSTKEGEA